MYWSAATIDPVVRKHLRGEEPKHFANILMWRSPIPASAWKASIWKSAAITGSAREDADHLLGVAEKSLQNSRFGAGEEVQRESWDYSGDISEMLRSFDDASRA